jgi:hypothetical protein
MHDLFLILLVGVFLYHLARAPFDIFPAAALRKKRTATATGKVLSVRFGKLHWGTNVPKPEIEFFDAHGQRFEFHASSGASWNPWPVGSNVEVFYDPNDPDNADIEPTQGMYAGIVIVLVIFALFAFNIAIKLWGH